MIKARVILFLFCGFVGTSEMMGQETQKQEDLWIKKFRTQNAPLKIEKTAKILSPDEAEQVKVFLETKPSTVFIAPLESAARPGDAPSDLREGGTATGMVWDTFGHIITNAHAVLVNQNVDRPEGPLVAQGLAKEVQVVLANGKSFKARVIGWSYAYDIAVLQVFAPLEDLKPIRLATSSTLMVGQKALVIGNPYGLDHTLSVGVISALKREVFNMISPSIGGVPIPDAIQVDAVINPGNSGGPLLDGRGYVIGMNTEVLSRTDGLSNTRIGFALSSDTLVRIVPLLIEFGRIPIPKLGFTTADDPMATTLGFSGKGALIEAVEKNSPAEQSGLLGNQRDIAGNLSRVGDLIVEFEGRTVSSAGQLLGYIEQRTTQGQYEFKIKRGEETVAIVLRFPKKLKTNPNTKRP